MHKSTYLILIFCLGTWCTAGKADVIKAQGHPLLAQGVLLIAGKNMADPLFTRTVILLTEYGSDGAAGLVLNRPTTLAASQVLPQIKGLVANPDTIHVGGPVAVDHIRLLVKGDDVPQGAQQIVDHIFMINTMETLRQLESYHIYKDNIRLYMGYAGWAPGQLETELLEGDWYIWPVSSEVIFSKHPENVWQELINLAMANWI
jgi:putative transcriptional regulator